MLKKLFLILGLIGSGIVQSVANKTIMTNGGEVCILRPHDFITITSLVALFAQSTTDKQVALFKQQPVWKQQCRQTERRFHSNAQLQKHMNNSRQLRYNGTIKQPDKR